MPALVRLGRVEQRVLVFLLVAAVLGAAVQRVCRVAIAVAGFDFGGPGVVFGGFAGGVVWVWGGGFVGEDAFAQEFEEVVD